MLKPQKGSIHFGDKVISEQAPNKTVADGIIHVPEGRLLFPEMSVRENLRMGAFLTRDKEAINGRLHSVFEMFPRLKERASQMAGTLSGGEQQMLAVGRGLMAGPTLLMLDEPSLGLAPKLVKQVFDLAQQINQEMGVTVLLVEQNVELALDFSERGYVISGGALVLTGQAEELRNAQEVKESYLGA